MSKLKVTVAHDDSQIIVTDDNDLFIGIIPIMWSKELNRFYINTPLDRHELTDSEIEKILHELKPQTTYGGQ